MKLMNIVETAKGIGAILATASVIGYISGYLVIRTRSFVLGTDPLFQLVDEAYVFAGFRFLLTTLIVLILSAPVLLVIRASAGWLSQGLNANAFPVINWTLLLILTAATLAALTVFRNGGILLDSRISDGTFSKLQEAILGGKGSTGLVVYFVAVIVTAASGLWLSSRTSWNEPSTWWLAVVFSIQAILLPMFHGAFFADRRVPVLGEVPEVARSMTAPAAIVVRTSEHAVLYGKTSNGPYVLATVETSDLKGLPVLAVESLWEYVNTKKEPVKSPSGVEERTSAPQVDSEPDPPKSRVVNLLGMATENLKSGHSVRRSA